MSQKDPISLAYAIPDHPWVDSAEGAAVRIAMTVGAGVGDGLLQHVVLERPLEQEEAVEVVLCSSNGCIHSDLTIGANVVTAKPLRSNIGLASVGIAVHGAGLVISRDQAEQFGYDVSIHINEVIRPYWNGKDITSKSRGVYLIDLVGYSEEQVRARLPQLYQHLLINTKPERDQNPRKSYRDAWWIPGEPRLSFRPALEGLTRYVVTPMTAKHRFFTFFTMDVLPDQGLVALAFDDGYTLGVLSSQIHIDWALAQGAILGPTPRYNASIVFDTFPFPICTPEQQAKIRELGERLDSHRKRQQELHPDLTLTGIYNVFEKLRTGEALTAKDKEIHDKGLVSVLKQIHDELDAAVLEAYGWADLVTAIPLADTLASGGPDGEALEQQLLTRLVALNHERAAEEKRGLIRWLRPDYQSPGAATAPAAEQTEITLPDDEEATPSIAVALAWPETMAEQVVAVRKLLTSVGHDAERLAACFGRKSQKRTAQITAILDTLRALGHIA